MKLFITGFIQVFFVAANTYFIAQVNYGAVFMAAFLISIVWSYNIKRIAFGSTLDRFVYAFGAACGSCAGLLFSVKLF